MSFIRALSFLRHSSFVLRHFHSSHLSPVTGPPITLSLPLLPARRSLLD
jgi:hypothetical protein